MFEVPETQYWDPIMDLARQDNSKLPQLFDYVESYEKPHRIMRAIDDNQTVEEMRAPLLDMFSRLDTLQSVLLKA